MVPQLHVHVISRIHGDAAWPKPVWGAVPATPYKAPALAALLTELRQRLPLVLDLVRDTPRELPAGDVAAINNSFGFGGHNVALVVTSA